MDSNRSYIYIGILFLAMLCTVLVIAADSDDDSDTPSSAPAVDEPTPRYIHYTYQREYIAASSLLELPQPDSGMMWACYMYVVSFEGDAPDLSRTGDVLWAIAYRSGSTSVPIAPDPYTDTWLVGSPAPLIHGDKGTTLMLYQIPTDAVVTEIHPFYNSVPGLTATTAASYMVYDTSLDIYL